MQSNKQVMRTKKYQALLAILGDEAKALSAYRAVDVPAADPKITALVAAGYTEEQAKRALGAEAATPATPAEPEPVAAKDAGKALVVEQGYDFARGRVYVTPDTIEAAVRVRKNGSPEIVASSGVGRTKAVLVYKEESGDVALCNLFRP